MLGIGIIAWVVGLRRSKSNNAFLNVVTQHCHKDVLRLATIGDISRICSSLAHSGVYSKKFFNQVDSTLFASSIILDGDSHDCAMLSWSFSKLNHDIAKSNIFKKIVENEELILDKGNVMDISQVSARVFLNNATRS